MFLLSGLGVVTSTSSDDLRNELEDSKQKYVHGDSENNTNDGLNLNNAVQATPSVLTYTSNGELEGRTASELKEDIEAYRPIQISLQFLGKMITIHPEQSVNEERCATRGLRSTSMFGDIQTHDPDVGMYLFTTQSGVVSNSGDANGFAYFWKPANSTTIAMYIMIYGESTNTFGITEGFNLEIRNYVSVPSTASSINLYADDVGVNSPINGHQTVTNVPSTNLGTTGSFDWVVWPGYHDKTIGHTSPPHHNVVRDSCTPGAVLT